MKQRLRNPRARQRFRRENTVVADIVDREHHRDVLYDRIVGIGRSQQRRHHRRLPVMAVKNVRRPDVLGHFNCGAGKFRKTLGVVRKFAVLVPIDTVAIEIKRIIQEEVSNSPQHRAVSDCRKAQPRALGDRQAGHHHRRGFHAAIPRQKHRHFMPQLHQGARQGLEHIREPAGLRVRQSFRSCKENAHRFSAKSLRYRRHRLASTSFLAYMCGRFRQMNSRACVTLPSLRLCVAS